MTINIQSAISSAYQKGIEVGRESMKREMAELDQIHVVFSASINTAATGTPTVAAGTSRKNTIRERTDRLVRNAATTKVEKAEPKAPIIARGLKAPGAPRTTGVKKAIMSLIANNAGLTTAEIVSRLGFKATSVNGTLMGLKKSGLASQDGKVWFLHAQANLGGNSETVHAEVGQ